MVYAEGGCQERGIVTHVTLGSLRNGTTPVNIPGSVVQNCRSSATGRLPNHTTTGISAAAQVTVLVLPALPSPCPATCTRIPWPGSGASKTLQDPALPQVDSKLQLNSRPFV